jgi:hypothetical protein
MGSSESTPDTQIMKDIKDVIKICNDRSIKSINPIYNSCQGAYPCQGHGGIVITFGNGSTKKYMCESDSIAGIMYFYDFQRLHFIRYLSEDCKKQIDTYKDGLEKAQSCL